MDANTASHFLAWLGDHVAERDRRRAFDLMTWYVAEVDADAPDRLGWPAVLERAEGLARDAPTYGNRCSLCARRFTGGVVCCCSAGTIEDSRTGVILHDEGTCVDCCGVPRPAGKIV